MIAWRVTKRRHSSTERILDGEGAREGGRWNRPGLALVYASENSSLGILETLVHVSERYLPKSLVAVSIRIPEDAGIRRVAAAELPKNWREIDSPRCVALGSAWIESCSELVLRVPSAANSIEENILLNPLHPDIRRCQTGEPIPLAFDPRIVALVR